MNTSTSSTPFALLPLMGLILATTLTGCGQSTPPASLQGQTMTVHYSPSCSCCGRYIEYLREKGLEVKTVTTSDRTMLSRKHGIPARGKSCHTGLLGDYFVEGHVPVQALDRLLTEKPDLAGITIPGMPRHAPGMGEPIDRELLVFSVDDHGQMAGVFDRVEW